MRQRAAALGLWISELDSTSIPGQLASKMRDHLLDTIGAAIVGTGRTPTRVAESVYSAPGEVPVLTGAASRDLRDAARVNAVASHAAEIDDTEGCDHTGAVVVSALMALFQDPQSQLSKDDLLSAMVAGYEVGRRVQNSLGGYDAANANGWHSTAICGVFAAAAAAARALGLNAEQSTAALAIAASSSSGGWAFQTDGSMTKQLHVANAAGNGVQAALLAQAGATGPTAIFDDDVWGGFFSTHGDVHAAPDELIVGLGSVWRAEHSAIKMYAACRSAHPALDGIVALLTQGRFEPRDVLHVEIRTSPLLRAMICPPAPETVEAARMSLPISIALLLLGLPLDPDTYEQFRDDSVNELLTQIHVVDRADLPSQQWVEVDIHVRDGDEVRVLSVSGDEARGSESHPFTAIEVRAKFRRLAGARIGTEPAERIIAAIETLGAVDGTGEINSAPFPSIWGSAET